MIIYFNNDLEDTFATIETLSDQQFSIPPYSEITNQLSHDEKKKIARAWGIRSDNPLLDAYERYPRFRRRFDALRALDKELAEAKRELPWDFYKPTQVKTADLSDEIQALLDTRQRLQKRVDWHDLSPGQQVAIIRHIMMRLVEESIDIWFFWVHVAKTYLLDVPTLEMYYARLRGVERHPEQMVLEWMIRNEMLFMQNRMPDDTPLWHIDEITTDALRSRQILALQEAQNFAIRHHFRYPEVADYARIPMLFYQLNYADQILQEQGRQIGRLAMPGMFASDLEDYVWDAPSVEESGRQACLYILVGMMQMFVALGLEQAEIMAYFNAKTVKNFDRQHDLVENFIPTRRIA